MLTQPGIVAAGVMVTGDHANGVDLVDALGADGTVAVVGAGGKKTTLYALGNQLERAVVTATVRIPIFDEHVSRVVVTDDPAAAIADADPGDWPLGVVPGREERDGAGRYLGYNPDLVADLGIVAEDDVNAVLVKADGARTRWLKAPGAREPQIPATADTVVAVASARIVGEPLTEEHVHRPERVGEVTGRASGDTVRSEDVARVLASDRGGLKDVPDGATVVVLVNMVDDDRLAAIAKEVATGVRDRSDRVDRIVLASMAESRVVDVMR